MNKAIETLLRYQDVDMQLRAIEAECENNESFRAAARARKNLRVAKERIDACEKKAEDILGTLARSEQEYDSVNAKIAELKQDVQESDADDDVDYIVGVFKKLQDSAIAIERDVEELQRQIAELTRTYNEMRGVMKESKATFEEEYKKYEEFYATKKADMDAYKTRLEGMTADIPPALFAKYSALRKEKRLPAVHELEKDGDTYRCPRCRMELDKATVETVRRNGQGECANCRHILYID